MTKRLRWFVHNSIAHPLMGVVGLLTGKVPAWLQSFHDSTAPLDG